MSVVAQHPPTQTRDPETSPVPPTRGRWRKARPPEARRASATVRCRLRAAAAATRCLP